MRHRLPGRRPGRLAPRVLLATVALVAGPRLASAQVIDPCAELPVPVVEGVLAASGIRAEVVEGIPMAFEGMGTCSYTFTVRGLRLELLARRAGSASEVAGIFTATPRPDGAVNVGGVGDEAFRYGDAASRAMMFRAGAVMGTVTLKGNARSLDAAVVELGRRWVARITGAPPLVAESPAPPAPAPRERRDPEPTRAVADASVRDAGAGSTTDVGADTLPACAAGITGPCFLDDAHHLALALREAVELEEGDALRATIREAVLASGFAIREDDGTTARPEASPAQGIAVQAWELEGTARLYERGAVFPLDTVAAALAALVPGTDGPTVVRHLLTDLRNAAGGQHASMQAWARLVGALGLQHQGRDLLQPAVREDLALDPLQLLLVLRRLSGELAARGKGSSSQHGFDPRRGGFDLRTAVAGLDGAPIRFASGITLAEPPRAPRAPTRACAWNDTESLILDWAALGITTGSGELVSYLEGALDGKAGQAVGTFAKFTGVANQVLALAQLALTYASIESEIEMDGSGPFLRTKSRTSPGERRTVHATVTMDIDDAEVFNCTRLALNQFGLDFSVPNGGPLAGVETWWRLEEGGVARRDDGTGYDYGIVRFGPGQFTQRRFTDAGGRTSVLLEGTPQREELSAAPREVVKQATVQLQVKFKGNDLVKDAQGLVGAVLSPATAPIAAAIESFYRSRVPVKALTFPVRDWTDRLRFRITRVEFGGGPGVECSKGATDNYGEVFDVTVEQSGATVEVRRNLGVCEIMESAAEGADHARCWLSGSWQGRMRLEGLYPQRGPDSYMHAGRPTRKGFQVVLEPYPGTKASVSGCDEVLRDEWRDFLEDGTSIWFPLLPDDTNAVRSWETVGRRAYLLEVFEGDLGTFHVR